MNTIKGLLILRFDAKEIRSMVIKRYMKNAGIKRAVCFSCGNASIKLIEAGVDTIDISPSGVLVANKWWTPSEIKKVFKNEFDATSGHLPLHLMVDIGNAFRERLGDLTDPIYAVPTGSGETILCLNMAYPDIKFVAMTNLNAATSWSDDAPLSNLVRGLFKIMDMGL